jgi:hypothetical protein
MDRNIHIPIVVIALATLLAHASVVAVGKPKRTSPQAGVTCNCDDTGDAQPCEPRITNADGEDGKNNSGPNSGNGGKGGTINDAGRRAGCGGSVSANGGKGGNNNKGRNSGNGGNGGKIEF